MTVAEIKEYIDEHIDDDEEVHTMQELRTLYGNTLEKIKSMLDELEQPIEIDTEKYFEQIDKLIDKEMAQYLKDQMKKALKKEIEKRSEQ